MAAMKALLEENHITEIHAKEKLLQNILVHDSIKHRNSFGLWMAVMFDSNEQCKKVIDYCIANGVLSDWFLFAPNCLRISPPLVMSKEQIKKISAVIINGLK